MQAEEQTAAVAARAAEHFAGVEASPLKRARWKRTWPRFRAGDGTYQTAEQTEEPIASLRKSAGEWTDQLELLQKREHAQADAQLGQLVESLSARNSWTNKGCWKNRSHIIEIAIGPGSALSGNFRASTAH